MTFNEFMAIYTKWHDEYASKVEAVDKMVSDIGYAQGRVDEQKASLEEGGNLSKYALDSIRDKEMYINLMMDAVMRIIGGANESI